MRRFLAVFLAVCVVAVAACSQAPPRTAAVAEDEAVPPPPPVGANVHVFCNEAGAPGFGARVNPWRVHTEQDTLVKFKILPVPGTVNVSTTLDPVPGKLWAFPQDTVYRSENNDSIMAVIRAGIQDSTTTYYRLTLTCPPTAPDTVGTVIVIDPIVIVDDPPR